MDSFVVLVKPTSAEEYYLKRIESIRRLFYRVRTTQTFVNLFIH